MSSDISNTTVYNEFFAPVHTAYGTGELKKKEHEIKTLKRIGSQKLRMNEKKGTKVIHVYAEQLLIIDFFTL